MKMNDDMVGKPSRTARLDFLAKVRGKGGWSKGDDVDRIADRPSAHELRHMSSTARSRAQEREFIKNNGQAAWGDDDEEYVAAEKPRRKEDVDDAWTFVEQEAQDWIDAEQEVQRMLGIDGVDDFGR